MIRKLFTLSLCLSLCLLVWAGSVHAQGLDPAYQALSSGNVYVDPDIHGVDAQKLEQASMQSQDNPHTRVKIALLAALPTQYSSRNEYASKLHQDLGLTKDALVLVVLRKRGAGISIVTTGLDPQESTRLAQQYNSAVVTNLTDGTAALAQAVASEINNKEYRSSAGLWVVFLLVILVVGGLIISVGRKKKQEMAIAHGPIETLRENVLSGIEYLDGYTDVLPKNNPDSDQTRSFRQAASAKYDQAVKILNRATEMTDLNRAQTLLDQAQADVQSARRALDRATGGTATIPGDDALRPPPLPDSQPAVDAIPPNQRGVSFFSGRPAPLSSLIPVTLTINGQSRQVLVTPDEADELRQGRMPQVLAFQQRGQSLPWYEYDNYDPYRDYWRYENSGWNGFGNGLAAGFIGAELLDSLTPNYGLNYGMPGYAYATDAPLYQGYTDPSFGNSSTNDVGGSDFMTTGNTSQEYDTNDQNDVGGSDFMTNDSSDAGSFDSGGSDFGSGSDFGGGDAGGGGDW